MQVRAFKLPPLPSRKNAPIQVEIRGVKKTEPQSSRRYPLSRQKRNFNEEESETSKRGSIDRRPSSVHSVSRETVISRDSKYSRGSSRERSIQIEKKQKAHYNVKARMSMPLVSAKSWAVYEMKQVKYIYGKRICKRREVASLTKIMNLITILELIEQLDLDATKLWVKVSKEASYLGGTTAQIKSGMQISLYDLYYGMMLPSGNDAAYQIAQIGGALVNMSKATIDKEIVYNIESFSEYLTKVHSPVKTYLCQMNKLSKKIGMINSNFANPHGLSNTQNYSCADDMCKLCSYCMQRQAFRKIVRTQFYEKNYKLAIKVEQELKKDGYEDFDEEETKIINPFTSSTPDLTYETLKWENTNKMLNQDWSGIKTGITPNAGPCLAASFYKQVSGRELQFLVVLISSKSMQARWKEVRELVDWVIDQKLYF